MYIWYVVNGTLCTGYIGIRDNVKWTKIDVEILLDIRSVYSKMCHFN